MAASSGVRAVARNGAVCDGAARVHRDLWLRHARHGHQLQHHRSELVRHDAPQQAAVVRRRVWRGRHRVRRRATDPAGRQRVHAHGNGRAPDHLRIRIVRDRRGRGADDVPPAPCLWRARQVRRGAVLEPLHGHRRVPELDRVLGPGGHGLLPQRPGALYADSGRHAAHAGGRAAWRIRRCRRAGRSHRAAEREGPQPDTRLHRRVPLWRLARLLRGGRDPGQDELGRHARRSVRAVRRARRGGAST